MDTIRTILFVLIVVMLVVSVYFSIRYRRESDPGRRGLFTSQMNISIGIMLAIIAVTQLFFFTDSVTRRVFGTVCLLLGLFNLFAGIRNYSIFSRYKEQGPPK
ncbi:YtpI family protein [Paenibacillus hamazuiensis]|uniref:YtpI family protein n=1 Tax=Paenibacillus hamazuiensis TaxID=2936508 RepID=UPI00200DBBDE|nr:YtpI family protein [Paenibacillus hamazuiensis]